MLQVQCTDPKPRFSSPNARDEWLSQAQAVENRLYDAKCHQTKAERTETRGTTLHVSVDLRSLPRVGNRLAGFISGMVFGATFNIPSLIWR